MDPRGWITRTEYDARGEKIAQISPSGVTTRFRYDAAGQLTAVIDGNGNETQYGYDNAGHLISVTDAKGAVTRFTYDATGRQTSATDPLGRTTHRAYDAAGDLITVTDPSGQAQHLSYDADHKLIRWSADDGTEVSYTYDRLGRRTSMTDATGTTHYAYDGAGHLLRVTYPDGSVVSAAYDKAGQRTSLTYPDGLQAGYRYNLNGKLVALSDSRRGSAAYALDPDGRLLTEQLPDRLARRYHYEHGLLHRFTVVRDDHPVASTALTYDPDGRIRTERGDGRLREYGYDRVGQLVSVRHQESRPWPWEHREHEEHGEHGYWQDRDGVRFTYDAVGNRTARRYGEQETRYRYDAADQLIASEEHGLRTEYQYDTSGRLVEEITGDRRHAIDYDGFGRPVKATRTGQWPGHRIETTFNGDGLPTLLVTTNVDEREERERSASVGYLWSHDDIPQILTQRADPDLDDTEREEQGRLSADFTYGYGRTFATWEHGTRAFHQDLFGSTLRTEQTEAWAQAPRYEVFGAPRSERDEHRDEHRHENGDEHRHELPAPELPRFGYRGELAIGPFLDLRARVYDASRGRFLTRDPLIGESAERSSAGHPYAYAENDPLNNTDPLGLLVAAPAVTGVTSLAAASTTPVSRANATTTVQHAVLMAATSRGGNRTSLHNAARDSAKALLNRQMTATHGAGTIHTEFPIPSGTKKFRGPQAPPVGTNFGYADILFKRGTTAWIWEVKSAVSRGDAWALVVAAGEVVHYRNRYMQAFPGSTALPGDPMAAPVPVAGYAGYIVFSPGAPLTRLGAVVYRRAPVPRPRPASQPAPHPVPQPYPVVVPRPQPGPAPVSRPQPVPAPTGSPGIDWGGVAVGVGVTVVVGAVVVAAYATGVGEVATGIAALVSFAF